MLTLVFHNLLRKLKLWDDYFVLLRSFLRLHFYSSMYAAIGSAVDNETETQQFTILDFTHLF